jgi:hypothetical protein
VLTKLSTGEKKMILDAQAKFSDPQTVTTGTDTGLVSEHTLDLGLAGRDIGTGKPLYVVATVTTAFTSAGSDDPLAVKLITDGDAALGSPTVLQTLFTFPAVSAAGTQLVGVIAPGHTYERYIGLQYISTGDGALTAGAVEAYLTETPPPTQAYYDSGFTVA